MLLKNNYLVFTLLIMAAFILRIDTFFVSSYDWDESLYFLGARALLDGHLPYTEIWDHKPPSIFFMHAISLAIFGDTISSIRISSCLAVGLTAFGLFHLVKRHSQESLRLAILSGILYIFSMNLNGGKAANSEIYYLAFIVYAFVFAKSFHSSIIISPKFSANWLYIFFCGLCIGIASSINYLALLYLAPLSLYILYFHPKEILAIQPVKYLLKLAALGLAGILIIFTPIVTTYYLSGNLNEFIYANFTANTVYISVEQQPFSLSALIAALVNQLSTNWLVWGLATSYFFLAKSDNNNNARNTYLLLALGWLMTSMAAVLVSRLYWPHYFLQMNPGICILAALALNQIATALLAQSRMLVTLGLGLMMVGGFYNSLKDITKDSASTIVNRHIKHIDHWGDTPRKISEKIKQTLSNTDYIFVADYNPIIYALTNAKIPTKYAFPPFLIGSTSAKMLPTSLENEIDNILAKKPIYIIKKSIRPAPNETNDLFYSKVNEAITLFYELDTQIDGIDLYKLKQS